MSEPVQKRLKIETFGSIEGNESSVFVTAESDALLESLRASLRELRKRLTKYFLVHKMPFSISSWVSAEDSFMKHLTPEIQSELLETQAEIVRLYFPFMEEAAQLLGVHPPVLNKPAVLALAMSNNSFLTREELAVYSKSAPTQYYLKLKKQFLNKDAESQAALKEYTARGKRIKSNEEAAAFIDNLWTNFKAAQPAFSALCVPSGAGKTQLAFSMPDDCRVVYLNIARRSQEVDPGIQPIYSNFNGYMWLIWQKLEQDMAEDNEEDVPLWIYGVIKALMELLANRPDLKLPEDLARIAISSEPVDTACDVSIAIKPSRKEATHDFIHTELAQVGNILFFLDEFTALNDSEYKKLAFIQRKLLNLQVPVVVASTDSGAMNMFKPGSATADSREQDRPWVILFPRLPRYVPDESLRKLVNACKDAGVKELLTLCLKSRPLFAGSVAPLIQEFLDTKDMRKQASVDLVENMRELVLAAVRGKKGALEPDGCYGYLVAMLSAGYCRLSSDKKYMQLLANFSTKNWAYLVNEAEIAPQTKEGEIMDTKMKAAISDWMSGESDEDSSPEDAPDDNAVFGDFRLEPKESEQHKRTVDSELHLVNSDLAEPISLPLFRTKGLGTLEDQLFFMLKGKQIAFKAATYFPEPSQDFLLYLVIAGTENTPGLHVADGGSLKRISASKLMELVWSKVKTVRLQSSNAVTEDWQLAEMRVSASFMTACNAGAVKGCSLEQLVTRFVGELVDAEEYVELKEMEKLAWKGEFKGQFIWPFDSQVPREVNEILGSLESTRPPNQQMFDAGTFQRTKDGNQKKLKVIIEVKTTTNDLRTRELVRIALKRQNSHAKVSFIVVNSSAQGLENFRINHLRCINRGTLRNTRLFRLDIDSNRCVVRTPLDGKPHFNSATRVIFLISLKDINAQIN